GYTATRCAAYASTISANVLVLMHHRAHHDAVVQHPAGCGPRPRVARARTVQRFSLRPGHAVAEDSQRVAGEAGEGCAQAWPRPRLCRLVQRAPFRLLPRLRRQIVGGDLRLVDGEAAEVDIVAEVGLKLGLDVAIDQHAGRIVVADVEYDGLLARLLHDLV